MRRVLCGMALILLTTGVQVASAQPNGARPAPQPPRPSDASAEDYVAPQSQASAKPEALPPGGSPQTGSSQGEKWRFRWHDGLWWYWLPSNSWVYWSDGRWVPYEAQSYADFSARRPRSYSYSNGGGPWGPVRYDQYGNRQYPYSRRTTGIQQLGPVPAMGGVRSLPGWGGER